VTVILDPGARSWNTTDRYTSQARPEMLSPARSSEPPPQAPRALVSVSSADPTTLSLDRIAAVSLADLVGRCPAPTACSRSTDVGRRTTGPSTSTQTSTTRAAITSRSVVAVGRHVRACTSKTDCAASRSRPKTTAARPKRSWVPATRRATANSADPSLSLSRPTLVDFLHACDSRRPGTRHSRDDRLEPALPARARRHLDRSSLVSHRDQRPIEAIHR